MAATSPPMQRKSIGLRLMTAIRLCPALRGRAGDEGRKPVDVVLAAIALRL
jgi:hypothetical protein